jgi:hypothetical protein
MNRMTGLWLAAVVGLASAPGASAAQESRWRTDHDAGWKAYQEGRFDEAETRLRAAGTVARGFGENDPKLATTTWARSTTSWARMRRSSGTPGRPATPPRRWRAGRAVPADDEQADAVAPPEEPTTTRPRITS